LNPLFKALNDENKALKKEIEFLSGDLNKFNGMVEILIDEN
jgi:hypothetical protein